MPSSPSCLGGLSGVLRLVSAAEVGPCCLVKLFEVGEDEIA